MQLPSIHTSHLALLAGASFFAGEASAANLLTNGSFEPDATGWTGVQLIYSHPYNGLSGIKLADTGGAQSTAATGNFNFNSLFYGVNNDIQLNIGAKFHGLGGGSQTISQATLTGAVSAADIDLGKAAFAFSAWLTSYTGDGNTPAVRVRFFSGDAGTGTVLGTQTLDRGLTANQVDTAQHLATGNYLNGAEDSRTDPDYWALYRIKAGVPAGTRSVIVDILAGSGHVAGGSNDWYVDAVVFDMVQLPAYHWTGLASTEWSTGIIPSPKNWELLGTGVDFQNASPVQFDDLSSTGTVMLSAGDVTPLGIEINNSSKAFSFGGSGAITGSTGISKSGTANLTISNVNTFTGRTNVTTGSLILENTLAVQNSTVAITSGQSQLTFGSPTAYTLGGLSGTAGVSLQNNTSQPVTLTVGNGNASSTFAGGFSGSGSLVKVGSGTLALQTASTLVTNTTLAGGWVDMLNKDVLGTGAYVSTGGGLIFRFGSGTSNTIPNNITLPATGRQMFLAAGNPTTPMVVELTGKITGGTAGQVYRFTDVDTSGNHNVVIRLTNPANDFQGTMEMWRGTLEFTSDAALGNLDNDIRHYTEGVTGALRFGADNITLNANRGIEFYPNTQPMPIDTQSYTGTIAGTFSGIGNFIKQGSGTLVLTGTNNATGITTISEGTLEVDGTFATGGLVTVGQSGRLSGSGTIHRSVTVQGLLAPGVGTGALTTDGTLTFGGFSTYQFEVSNWTGAAGVGYDQVSAGTIAITATPSNPVVIVVTPSNLTNFVDDDRSFVIATGANAVSGFDPAAFLVDTSAMPTTTGIWQVRAEGNNLVLSLGYRGYTTWIQGKGLSGDDAKLTADPDQDGIVNALEFLFGGEPNPANVGSDALDKLPTIAMDPETLHFVFRRTAASVGELDPFVQISTNLTDWTPVEELGEGVVTTTVDENGFVDAAKVTVDIARGGLPEKVFVRLVVPNL